MIKNIFITIFFVTSSVISPLLSVYPFFPLSPSVPSTILLFSVSLSFTTCLCHILARKEIESDEKILGIILHFSLFSVHVILFTFVSLIFFIPVFSFTIRTVGVKKEKKRWELFFSYHIPLFFSFSFIFPLCPFRYV